MKNLYKKRKQRGQGLVEYALIGGLFVLILLAINTDMFNAIKQNFWLGLQTTNVGKVNMPEPPSGTIETSKKPKAIISGPTRIHVSQTLTLTDDSIDPDGRIVRTSWGAKTYTKKFVTEGTFVVSLTVWDNDGNSDTASTTIEIYNTQPVADILFEFANTYDRAIENRKFTVTGRNSSDPDGDGLDTFEWQLNGQPFNPVERTHAEVSYPKGNYTFSLRVRDAYGKWSDWVHKQITVHPNRGPIAILNLSPANPVLGKEIVLDGTSSYDPDGDSLVNFKFYLPDGSVITNSSSNKRYTYVANTKGTLRFGLQVSDQDNLYGEITYKTITVRDNTPPVPIIDMNPATNISDRTPVSFSFSRSYDPEGDSIINTQTTGIQTYYPEGTHTVSVRMQDSHGLWSNYVTKTFTVARNQAPNAPVCTRTPSGGITESTRVVINCTATDPEGDPVTIHYSQPLRDYYPAGKVELTITAKDIHGNESRPAAMVFYVISPTGTGGVKLTNENTTLIQEVPEGATAKSYTFNVPSVNGHSGNDYGRVRGYNAILNRWEQIDYRSVYNGVYMTGNLTPGIYTKIEFYYYASHCMYGQSNITYSVDYAY